MGRFKSKALHDPDGGFSSVVRRRRWTSAEARAVLAALQQSGMRLAAFARRHRLSPHRLYQWQRRLKGAKELTVTTSPRFLPVTVVGPRVEAPDSTIEIFLAGDRSVRIHGAFDIATFARVIEVLERSAC